MKLGILGGGQLARMLAQSAYPLGIKTVCIDPSKDACAGEVTQLIHADYTDQTALTQFIQEVDCVTLETENIPLACVDYLERFVPVYPNKQALTITQDRLTEKSFSKSLGIDTAAFEAVKDERHLEEIIQQIGYPTILKIQRFGYDGKGQFIIRSRGDIAQAYQALSNNDLIVEKFVNFEFECSLICVRNQTGEMAFYPLVKNQHKDGVLRISEAPLNQPKLQQAAQRIAAKILQTLKYVGVLTIEFFVNGEQLLVNEMAPRVHNSGHWTIEGAETSQFENHLRAVFNLPLGSTEAIGYSILFNCLGEMPSLRSCLSIPGAHYHSYSKQPRPMRKLGHITCVSQDISRYEQSKAKLEALFSS